MVRERQYVPHSIQAAQVCCLTVDVDDLEFLYEDGETEEEPPNSAWGF